MNLSPRNRKLADAAREAVGNACLGFTVEANDELVMNVPPPRIAEAMLKLRESESASMTMLMDVCGVDYPARAERFEVVYQLLSLKHNWRLRVRVTLGEGQSLSSVAAVYPSAGWFEREVFDLFGISFDGHPDLRRILTDYNFEGHPLRRDFPLVGFTQVRYDDLQRKVMHEPVSLEQDYRAFDALSPWGGITDVQKRGDDV